MPARKWDEATKSRALELFAERGGAAAEVATGVPQATIRSWARRTVQAVEVTAGVELVAHDVPWRERRAVVLAKTGDLVVLGIEETRKAFENGKLRDARDGAVAVGILIDKAQLLSGLATDRRESMSVHLSGAEVQSQIKELEQELGHR